MRLYVEVARRSFQRHLAYRAATLAGLFTNSVFGIMIASVYLALYRGHDRTDVAGFGVAEALTFVWVGQSLLMVIAASVQSGDIVTDLMKPFNFHGYWLSRDLGRAACHALTRLAPTLLIGSLVSDLALPRSGGRWLAFLASVVLAVLVSFGWWFLLNLSAFWLLDIRGVMTMSLMVVKFFSGFLVPLAFFPPGLRHLADLLPFRAIVMVPIEVFLSQRSLASAFAIQCFWAVALALLGQLCLRGAVRKMVIQGG